MFYTERGSMTSCYHGSKISGSQQSFLIETASCIDEQLKKSIVYRLFLIAIMRRKVIHVNFFVCFFLPNLQDHSLLRSRKVLPLQRDVMTFTLYCPSNSISNQSKFGQRLLVRNSETFWMNGNNVYMMSKNVEIWGLLSNLLTMHHREFASRFASRTSR